ncbi:MAG: hypothetical protein ACK559_29410, partial [bacterium]
MGRQRRDEGGEDLDPARIDEHALALVLHEVLVGVDDVLALAGVAAEDHPAALAVVEQNGALHTASRTARGGQIMRQKLFISPCTFSTRSRASSSRALMRSSRRRIAWMTASTAP